MSRHAEHYESGLDTFAGAHYSTGGNVGSVALIGGGPGDAGLITVRGLELLYAADVVVADRLGPRSLLDELADDRIPTGFVGTPVILDALTATGHVERAYALLRQTECPSWLYMVGQGARTMWERWDSQQPDGTVNPGGMTSFNHYALGAVADWLHGTVAGLRQATPEGGEVLVEPHTGGGLSWASAWLETSVGRFATRWDEHGPELVVTVEVPVGGRAVLCLADTTEVLGSGHHQRTWHRDAPPR